MSLLNSVLEKVLQLPFAQVPVLSTKAAVAAMFGLVYVSKFLQAFLSIILLGSYDNVQATYRTKGADKASTFLQRLVNRAYNAHQNQIEAFIGFSVAVCLALLSGVRETELAPLANAFLAVRVVYNVVYILAFNAPLSFVRSAVFTVGVIITIRIFQLAVGNDMYYK